MCSHWWNFFFSKKILYKLWISKILGYFFSTSKFKTFPACLLRVRKSCWSKLFWPRALAVLYLSLVISWFHFAISCFVGKSGQFPSSTTKYRLNNCQAIIRQLSGSCQAIIRQSSGSCQAVVRQLSGSCKAVVRLLSGSCQAVVRQLSGNHQAVVKLLLPFQPC